jgi:hypothetical protein
MIKEELQEEEEVVEDETTQEDEVEEQDDEQGVEYWKAEALKNKAILDRNKNKPQKSSKSGDFDYGEMAFLAQKGIESEAEVEFTKKQMKESGKKLHEIVNASWFKAELADMKEVEKSLEATPSSRRSGGVAANSTDYWLSKPIEDVPKDMLREVVKAKREKAESGSKFYNS